MRALIFRLLSVASVASGCWTGDGASYSGTWATTENGLTCQAWSSNSPHSHNYNSESANYCRNPDGEPRPWCYTTDPNVRWEYCSLSQCQAAPSAPPPPPPLQAGDCVIVGHHSDSPDRVAILLLAPLGPGQSIKVSDRGANVAGRRLWGGSSDSDSVETITNTGTGDWPAGYVIIESGLRLSSSSSGEDIVVFQGSTSNPTFICAAEFGSNGFSSVPAGLTVGVTAVQLPNRDNCVWNGLNTGARPALSTLFMRACEARSFASPSDANVFTGAQRSPYGAQQVLRESCARQSTMARLAAPRGTALIAAGPGDRCHPQVPAPTASCNCCPLLRRHRHPRRRHPTRHQNRHRLRRFLRCSRATARSSAITLTRPTALRSYCSHHLARGRASWSPTMRSSPVAASARRLMTRTRR